LETAGGIFFQSVISSTVTPRVLVSTISRSSGTVQILPTPSTQTPATQGTVLTSLYTAGFPTGGPLLSTSISAPSSVISVTAPATSPTSIVTASMTSNNIFQPVETDAPPSVIGSRADHPVPRLGIKPQNSPIGTNKFYANFFLGSQTAASWTHPYSVSWSKGGGSSRSWGMSIQHIDANQKVFGPDPSANPVQYFINPIGIQSLVLSACELGASTTLSMDSITAFSANVNLLPNPSAAPAITFPLVQGMGFVTGIYNGGTPILQTGVFFRSIAKATTNPKSGITKYTVLLEDGKTWLLYAYSLDGKGLSFTVVNNSLAQATSNFNGIIQIAKNPGGAAESLYDAACGVYSTTANLSGGVNGATGSYTLSFAKAGITDATLMMFALPHHVESFSQITRSALTTVQLNTTTKGLATAVLADSWTLVESLPTGMGFAPWSPSLGPRKSYSAAEVAAIHSVAASEVSQNMNQQTNLNSMYFSGKVWVLFRNR
jgi:endo-1,3(4)-beta-glucanase